MRLAARIAWLGVAALIPTAVAVARQVNPAGPGIKNPALLDVNRPPQRELQTNVPDGFTVTAVGDLIISRPLSQYATRDSKFKAVLDALHGTDVLYGNLETTIFDVRTFKGYPYSFEGDWTNSSLPSVARDLRAMGFDLVSRANNHSFDWGLEGMRETNEWLNRAGVAYAGVGEDRALARAAAYFESTKGRIGLVSFASTYRPTTDALPAQGAAPARPGLSALAVSEVVALPPGDMQSLAHVGCHLYHVACGEAPPTIALFGNTFKTSDTFHYEYSVDPQDLAGIDAAIRSGKQNGDFLIAAIHSHECSIDCDDPRKPELPAAFLRKVAHDAIDSGADVFVTTGIHNLGPIEIYRGRPVFYGLGNFFWSDIQLPLPHDLYQENAALLARVYAHPERVSPYDLSAALNAESFANSFTFQSVLAKSTFVHNRLAKITLYALDLGYGRKLTTSGIPEMADPSMARTIFARIVDATRQYGLPPLDMHVDGSVATILP
jgi:poly-gamma-glutamate capsule biosynthesis protein CapA/YwtB (metallophosphatase superfamily)